MVTDDLFKMPTAPATATLEPVTVPEVAPVIAPEVNFPTAPAIQLEKKPAFDPRVIAKAQLVYPQEAQAKMQKQMLAQATPSGAWGEAVPGR